MTHDLSAVATCRELFHLAGGMAYAGLGLPATPRAEEAAKTALALDFVQRCFPQNLGPA